MFQVQPVLTFQQFVASSVCRDVATSVSTRLQRVASLTDAVLLSDATVHLLRLMQGERLPLAFHVGVRQLDVKVTTAQFSTASCVLDPGNIRVWTRARMHTRMKTLAHTHTHACIKMACCMLDSGYGQFEGLYRNTHMDATQLIHESFESISTGQATSTVSKAETLETLLLETLLLQLLCSRRCVV